MCWNFHEEKISRRCSSLTAAVTRDMMKRRPVSHCHSPAARERGSLLLAAMSSPDFRSMGGGTPGSASVSESFTSQVVEHAATSSCHSAAAACSILSNTRVSLSALRCLQRLPRHFRFSRRRSSYNIYFDKKHKSESVILSRQFPRRKIVIGAETEI